MILHMHHGGSGARRAEPVESRARPARTSRPTSSQSCSAPPKTSGPTSSRAVGEPTASRRWYFLPCGQFGVRLRPGGGGSVLLPRRPELSSTSRSTATSRTASRRPATSRRRSHCARGRASRPEPAGHRRAREWISNAPASNRRTRSRCAWSCSRLLRRRLGGRRQPERPLLEPGDVEEGLGAAAAVGDDRIQMASRGDVSPEPHSSQRPATHALFGAGSTGDLKNCDAFAAAQL